MNGGYGGFLTSAVDACCDVLGSDAAAGANASGVGEADFEWTGLLMGFPGFDLGSVELDVFNLAFHCRHDESLSICKTGLFL